MQTLKSKAILLVRYYATAMDRKPKDFVITTPPKFKKINLARDDVIPNILTEDTALKRQGNIYWRGPKEKAVSLMKLFIGGLSPVDGLVVDLTVGTGQRSILCVILL